MFQTNSFAKYLAVILFTLSLLLTTAQAVSSTAPDRIKVLVSFYVPPGYADVMFIRYLGGRVHYRYHLINAIAVTIPETAISRLLNHPKIFRIEPDLPLHAVDSELDNSWGVKHIGSGFNHENGIRGEGVNIAIIDSGIDASHPDLDGNYKGGFNFVVPNQDPVDVYGHGTHVAGIACAEDNNNGLVVDHIGYGVIGVAPMCNLYALKVLEDNGWGDSSDLIAALEWAVQSEMDVANLSLGWDRYPGEAVEQAFVNAENAGLVIVAAACNNGKWHGRGENVCYPGKFPSVIAVVATDIYNTRATFSSTGPEVELSAPGVSVLSTWNGLTSYSTPEPVCHTEEGVEDVCYKYGSGTSMAAPHVAGVAALMIEVGVTDLNGNGRINDDIRQILIDTVIDIGDPGWDPLYGHGLVNAIDAVANSVPPEPYVDVAITNLSGPESVVRGDIAQYEVILSNFGTENATTFEVLLVDSTSNNEIIGSTFIDALAPGATSSRFFDWDTALTEMGIHQLVTYQLLSDDNQTNDSRLLLVNVIDDLPSELFISHLEPDQIMANTLDMITIYGTGFAQEASVIFEGGKGAVPEAITKYVSLDGTEIVVDIVTKKTPKITIWDVRVTNPDGSTYILGDGLTVHP